MRNGQPTALDSDTGQRLWSFQTDGGFTTTATTFERDLKSALAHQSERRRLQP